MSESPHYSLSGILASLNPYTKGSSKSKPFDGGEAEKSKEVVFVESGDVEKTVNTNPTTTSAVESLPESVKQRFDTAATTSVAYTNASVWIARGVGLSTILFLAFLWLRIRNGQNALTGVPSDSPVARLSSAGKNSSTAHGLTTGYTPPGRKGR